jgi:hypothetical protein
MKKFLLPLILFGALHTSAQKKDYPFRAVAFNQVKLSDNFWLPRL